MVNPSFLKISPPDINELILPCSTEIELQYATSRASIKNIINDPQASRVLIYQVYLDPKRIPWATDLILERNPTVGKESLKDSNKVRVRRVKDMNGEVTYEIGLKGPKEKIDGLRVQRLDVNAEITKKEFKRLCKKWGEGALSKVRVQNDNGYELPDSDSKFKVNADFILRFGLNHTPPKRAILWRSEIPRTILNDLVIVECELQSLDHLHKITSNIFPLDFLRYAMPLSTLSVPKYIREIRTSALACNGVSKKALKKLTCSTKKLAA